MSLDQLEAKTKWIAAEVFAQFGMVLSIESTGVSFIRSFMKDTCTMVVLGEVLPDASAIMDVMERKFFDAFTEVTMERHGAESISITVHA